MAIIQKPDALSMSGNMKKFIVSSGSQIVFELKEGITTLLSATYEPGVDGRATIDVKDIIESRLSYTLSHTDFYEQTNIVKTFTAIIDGSSFTFKVIRCGVANLADTVSNWLRDNFLTWQPTNKQITYYSPEWITYYAQEACTVKLKATFPDAEQTLITLGSCDSGKAFTFNLQYAIVSGLLGQKYPTHYDVWVENLTGTRLTYIQRYLYTEQKSDLEQWFLFENSLGGLDTIRTSGDTDFTGEYDHKLSSTDNITKEYLVDAKRVYNQNTGYLDDYERRWLLDFFPAIQKYIYHISAIRKIVVTDSDVKYSAAALPSSYNFSYHFTEENEAALLNLIRNQEAIPASITIPNLDSPDFHLPPRLSEYPRVPLHEGVILPAFDPNSEDPKITTIGAIIAKSIEELLKNIPGSDGLPGSGGQMVNIVREDDVSSGNDNTVYSSLRTLKEIQKALQDISYTLDKRYLSKVNQDTAEKIIRFIEGLEIGDFTSGLLGSGAAIKNVDGITVAEVDQLKVRMRAEFFSVMIHNAKHIGGELVISAAGMLCVKVEETANFYRCYFDSGENNEVNNLFTNQDRARCKVFTGSGQKFYWRKVVAVGSDYIELSKTDMAPGDNDIPEVGDNIFQLGSDDPERQGAMIFSTIGADAPSFKQYAGINGYVLGNDKLINAQTGKGNFFSGKSVFKSNGTNYDDWSNGIEGDIQDTQAAANAAALLAQQAIDEAAANVVDYNTKFAEIQAQVDGEISNYSYPYKPTLLNYPASEWTTDIEKDRHVGDTFYNSQAYVDDETTPDAGKAWRFVKNATIYSWSPIADSDAVKALRDAAKAQAMADGKSTTHFFKPDTPKADGYCYKLGDMWVLNSDQTVNGTAYKQGEILTATQDSATYNQAHWIKRVRYTDDSAVNNLEIGGRNLFQLNDAPNKTSNSFIINNANNSYIALRTLKSSLTVGETYTFFSKIKYETIPTSAYSSGSVAISVNDGYRDLMVEVNQSDRAKLENGEIIKYKRTFTLEEKNAENFMRGFTPLYGSTRANVIYIEPKLVVGIVDKKGDWTPAPEDVQAQIDEAIEKATFWSINLSSPVIYKDAINASTSGAHSSVIVKGELHQGTNITNGGFITVTPNGGTEAGTATASPVTIAPANGEGKTNYTVRLYNNASKSILLDTQTIPVVFKGASGVNAINAILSNEADVLPASPEGTVSDYSGSGTEIRVFEGATELSYGTGNGQYQVSAVGSGITVGTPSTSGNRRVYGVASNMTSDNATITFTISGKTASGASFSLTKVQAFAKSRTGQKGDTGASAPLLYLSASAQVMKCNPDNTPQTGQTISIEAKLQNVSGTATFVATPYNDAGTALTAITLGGSGNTRTLTNAQWLATFKRVEVIATLGSLTDKVTIYRVADGATGKGISGTEIKYQVGASGTTAPTGTWLTSVPTVPEGQFLWTRTVTSYTDSTSTTSYSVSKQGISGSDGKGISTTVITYQASSSGTAVPTGTWSGTIPSVSENQFLWTRTVITYTDSSTSTSYSVGKMGAKGDAGQNAIVGLLTNESVTLQANNAGVVSSFTPANGEFWVYNGTTRVTTGITFSKVSNTGCTATINSSGAYSVSAMTADNATAIFRAVYNGVTIEKTLSLSKSKAGADGVSITLVDVEFAKNTSPTTAPTTGWTTTAPTLTGTEQLWTRTKTTYSSGNPTYSTPANITPKKGDTGAVGQGVESVTEEYAISTSKTTQPTTGWSTTQPTWSQGQYIWSRVKVVYKNPTSTVYTGYAVSSEWEAVNDLEIGGRNLVLNSLNRIRFLSNNSSTYPIQDQAVSGENYRQFRRTYPEGITSTEINTYTETLFTPEKSGYYTYSTYFRPNDFDIELRVRLGNAYGNITLCKKGEWTQVSVTGYIGAGVATRLYGVYGEMPLELVQWIDYNRVSVTSGNKPTDWTPAPEDVEAEIDSAKQEALTASNTVQTNVDSLNTYVTGAFKDGVISEAEAKAIEKYLNTINETMAKAEASYNKVYANTYLEGAAKTALLNAKINLWGQRDTLLTAINTAIAGGTTTPAQKIAVDNAFSSFNSLMSAFQSALEEANKAIQAKLDSLSKGYSDDVLMQGKWTKVYMVNTDNPLPLRHADDTLFNANYSYEVSASILSGTSTVTQLVASISNNGAGVFSIEIISQKGTSINHPRIFIEENTPMVGLYNHSRKYAVTVDAIRWVGQKTPSEILEEGIIKAQADANKSAAITDKFGTDITGGLITTVMMLLREVNSQINTAGFSGIQGALLDQPSYWSGGTHIQAQAFVPFVKKLENEQSTTLAEYNNLPSIVFLHNGAAKIGHFIVLTSGEILIIDKNTGAIKLKFSTSDLPAIADLIAGTNSSGSTPIGGGVASTSSSQVVSGSTVVSKNGAIATFNGTHISLSARGIAQAGGMASFAEAVLYARQNGVRVQRLASVTVHFTNTVYEDKSAEVSPVPFSFPLDAGTYTFELVIHTTGTISSGNAVTSASNLSWKHTVAGVKQQQYAKDGMMFFYSNRHFYFNELTGLDVKESDSSKFNMPGVLLSATVNENGGWNRVWGAKQSLTQPPLPSPTGRYTIYHTIGHTNYQVNCVSYAENRSFRLYQKNTNNVIVECRTIGSTPVLVNAMFDIILTGNNY